YRFTHAQMEKDGIIVESNVPENRRANIFFNITSPSSGTFIIALHYKGREKAILEMDLKLDDLLEKQKDDVQLLDLDSGGRMRDAVDAQLFITYSKPRRAGRNKARTPAAYLTGGNYLRLDLDEKGDAVPSTRNGSKVASNHTRPLSLLQLLLTTFLPSRDLRYFPPSLSLSFAASTSTDASGGTAGILRLPTLDSVDFRAACFCHRKVVDVGFVCSVCLSIFCELRKECLICGSHFPRSTMRRFADEHKLGRTEAGEVQQAARACVVDDLTSVQKVTGSNPVAR
ncbi:hypothetical protein A4X13_0g6980, partial [Tilletia indica]